MSNEPITDIEKMVWASTFSLAERDYRKSIPTHNPNDAAWKNRCATFAVQRAYETVCSLRKMSSRFQYVPEDEDESPTHSTAQFLIDLGFSKEDGA